MKLDFERFWKGLGWTKRKHSLSGWKPEWTEPCWVASNGNTYPLRITPNEVRLEVLLDGLERLEPGAYHYKAASIGDLGVQKYYVHSDISKWDRTEGMLAVHADRRTAIIAAICKLLGMEVEE